MLTSYGTTALNCNKNELEKKNQLEAGRIVTGTTKLTNIQKLYDELGWDKLSDRRRLHNLQLFYKMDNHLAPDYLCNILPSHIREVSSYPIRNADNYTQIHSRTALYGSSFLPSAIREWNKLPTDHRNAESQDMFIELITDTNDQVPCYYYCGNRIEQMLYTRLRTEAAH